MFWGVFSHCEASGSQSFLFSCAFHSADAIMIARALGGAFYTQLPRLRHNNEMHCQHFHLVDSNSSNYL